MTKTFNNVYSFSGDNIGFTVKINEFSKDIGISYKLDYVKAEIREKVEGLFKIQGKYRQTDDNFISSARETYIGYETTSNKLTIWLGCQTIGESVYLDYQYRSFSTSFDEMATARSFIKRILGIIEWFDSMVANAANSSTIKQPKVITEKKEMNPLVLFKAIREAKENWEKAKEVSAKALKAEKEYEEAYFRITDQAKNMIDEI